MKRRRFTGWLLLVVALVLAVLVLAACQASTPATQSTPLPTDLPLPSATRGELPSAAPVPLADTATPEISAPDMQATDDDAQQETAATDLPLPPPGAPGDSRVPIFVEIVQEPLSPELSPQMPPADANPTGVYLFNPGDRSLLVAPAIQVLPATEVLVGLSSASVPGRPYVASDLFQLPSAQPAPLRVIALDADTGTLTLAYADQTFELGPGESRSFKQKGEGELAPLYLTTITNHGSPATIGPLPPDPGSP